MESEDYTQITIFFSCMCTCVCVCVCVCVGVNEHIVATYRTYKCLVGDIALLKVW